MSNTKHVEPRSACTCTDPELQLLRDLIARGMGQWEASQVAFGTRPPFTASPAVWRAWRRIWVRRVINDARRALGYPLLPSVPVELDREGATDG